MEVRGLDEEAEIPAEVIINATDRFLGRLYRFHPEHAPGLNATAGRAAGSLPEAITPQTVETPPAEIVPIPTEANLATPIIVGEFPTIDLIISEIAHYYGLKVLDLRSSCQTMHRTRPRQVAMYLCHELTLQSLPTIGRKLGDRDRTTIWHGINKITDLMKINERLRDDVDVLKLRIKHAHLGRAA